MQHRLRSPPGFVVIEIVLWETAHIDDAELRIDRRPSVGRRLAAIIETGPGKSARKPFARGIELPPFFGGFGPWGKIQVIRAEPIPQLVRGIDSPRRDGAGSLRSHGRRLRMFLVPLV